MTECVPFFESQTDEFERIRQMFTGDTKVMKFGEDYTMEEGIDMFLHLAQATKGDAKDNYSERPPITDPRNRMMYDYWIELDGMPREEARRIYLEKARPIVERNGFQWENPQKEIIDREYNKCVEEQLAEGATVAELEAARKAYLDQEESRAQEEMAQLDSVKVKKQPPRRYLKDIMQMLLANCCFFCCIACLCRSI